MTPALVVLAALALASVSQAQVPDHLKCYKVKDSLKLGGTADLDTPQFGVDPGCKVSKAALFCVPATKTNVAVTNKQTKEAITPLPIGGGASGARPDDRLCYKVKCPEPTIPDQSVTDQFGNRTVSKFKASFVCTPAFKGTARFVDNGNSITDNYTGLQWVKTYNLDGFPNPNDPVDADHTHTWSSSGSAADGTAFTTYLGALNACTWGNTLYFAGFAGHCDWRLPTVVELRTIIDTSVGACAGGSGPCIDPIFGPTATGAHPESSGYWTSPTSTGDYIAAWVVNFSTGSQFSAPKTYSYFVRAVRGGSAD